MTPDIDTIQRDYKLLYDYRNEVKNERKSVYEIEAHKRYVLLHKKAGHIIAAYSAQNGLTLVLKHFNN